MIKEKKMFSFLYHIKNNNKNNYVYNKSLLNLKSMLYYLIPWLKGSLTVVTQMKGALQVGRDYEEKF